MKKAPAGTTFERTQARFGSRRADLVDLLQRGVGTVSKLSARLGVTKNAIRAHLLALQRQGLVHRVGSEPGTRRPHEVYQLSPNAQELLVQASSASLTALLTAMKRLLPAEKLPGLLEAGGEALAARFKTGGKKKSLLARVQNAAQILNALGGTAEVKKEGRTFCIKSQGCPLAAVVAEHPETCLMVETFLAQVVRAPVRESCLRGLKSQCQFAIGSYGERMIPPDTSHPAARPPSDSARR